MIEENWISDILGQFGQMNNTNCDASSRAQLYDNVARITFRRNVVANVSWNGNVVLPGMRFENNTFYRMAFQMDGFVMGGSLSRGNPSDVVFKNNVFLGGGSKATVTNGTGGFYSEMGAYMNPEVIEMYVTHEANLPCSAVPTPIACGVRADLRTNGYLDASDAATAKARALTDISQFVLAAQFDTYKPATYATLKDTIALNDSIHSTLDTAYNYVAGAPEAGYPAKASSGCDCSAAGTRYRFCEVVCNRHGINGGDPRLANVNDLLGPDGLPFTADDGLKPMTGSPLCSGGEGGASIGAYSCEPDTVFALFVKPKSAAR